MKALRDVPPVKSFNHHLALVAPPMLSGGVEGDRVTGVAAVGQAGVRVERGSAHELTPERVVCARLVMKIGPARMSPQLGLLWIPMGNSFRKWVRRPCHID